MKKLTLIVLMIMLMAAVLPTFVNAQDPTDAGTDTGTTDVATDAGADGGTTDVAADAGTDGGTTDAAVDAGADSGTTDAAVDAGTTDGGTTGGDAPAQDGGEPPAQEGLLETTVHGKSVTQVGNTYIVNITEESINALFGSVVPGAVHAIYLDLQNGQIVIELLVQTSRKGEQEYGGVLSPNWVGVKLYWTLSNATSSTGKVPAELGTAAQNQFTSYLLSAGLADLKTLPAGVKFVSMQLVDNALVLTFSL
jgi:hypothetical protein